MQQRVVIAMALAKNPALLILDEPTTGLDATVEAEVLDLVAGLQAELHTSVLFISHNLGVIAKMCDRVGVLYAGRLVEEGETEHGAAATRATRTRSACCAASRAAACARITAGSTRSPASCRTSARSCRAACSPIAARWPRTICRTEEPPLYAIGGAAHEPLPLPRAGADAAARDGRRHARCRAIDRAATPLLRFDDLGKVFKQQGHDVHALVGVSAAIWPGETLGLVGESGSGKTTLARTLLGLVAPTSGAVTLDGRELAGTLAQRTRDGHARAADRLPESRLGAQPPPLRCAGSCAAR